MSQVQQIAFTPSARAPVAPEIPGAAGSALAAPADGVLPRWWNRQPPVAEDAAASPSASPATSLNGLFDALLGGLNQAVSAAADYVGRLFAEGAAEGPAVQDVAAATFSSTGDPHLAESGRITDASGTPHEVDNRFDSMSAHTDLLSSQDFDGGYRVSTAVTEPNANGVTLNQSATVHTNADRDQVTLNADGSALVVNGGTNVTLGAGQSMTLGDGELVTRNTDGSLTIAETNAEGGSIATTLRTNGSGVDVIAAVSDASVGGDIARGAAVPEVA